MYLSKHFFVSFHKKVIIHADYFLSILAIRTRFLFRSTFNDITRPGLTKFLKISGFLRKLRRILQQTLNQKLGGIADSDFTHDYF